MKRGSEERFSLKRWCVINIIVLNMKVKKNIDNNM